MRARRSPVTGRFTREEVALATRNHGMPLEALREEITPAGLHYLLIHFDIPAPPARLEIGGLVERPLAITPTEIRSLPSRTLRVTLECAGNGRAQLSPRYPSMPWLEEGVSTADWTGVPLRALLERAGVRDTVREIAFFGADRGIDGGIEHPFARSLTLAHALHEDVLVAYAMNGAALPPQHGAPLRLVVPGWYGMASVKWLASVQALAEPFDGPQQVRSYHFRRDAADAGTPCTRMRVNSLMVPPGIPDFYTRSRMVEPGLVEITGRAWSGEAAIAAVEFAVDGRWSPARLTGSAGPYSWTGWQAAWQARPGEHELACRATDAAGHRQPLEGDWDLSGFGNNAVHRMRVTVRG
ncbi:MAG: sulfite oxidase [Betaproteobacteria bacterium]